MTIRAHPGASRVLLTRFLGIQKVKCITVAQENEFQYFPEMVPITKKQFEKEYPDLTVEALPKENDEFDHFEIRPKNFKWGTYYTRINQDIQYGNKVLLSLSHDLPVYTDMTQEQLD